MPAVTKEQAIAAAKHSAGVFCNDEDIETMRYYILQSPPTVERCREFINDVASTFDTCGTHVMRDKEYKREMDRLTAELMTIVGGAKPDECEHGVREGDWCEPCNKAMKAAIVENEVEGIGTQPTGGK